GVEKKMGDLNLVPADIMDAVKKAAESKMTQARQIVSKNERGDAVEKLCTEVLDQHFVVNQAGTYGDFATSTKRRAFAKEALRRLEEKIRGRLVVEKGIRADGRKATQIRDFEGAVGIFARTHGSAFFQRGETQSLVSCTLGTGKDEQIIDGLIPEYSKK